VSLLDTPELMGLAGNPNDGDKKFDLDMDGEELKRTDESLDLKTIPEDARSHPKTTERTSQDYNTSLKPSSPSIASVSMLSPTGDKPLRRKESLICLDALLQLEGHQS
jgi:hypothetical protein